MAGLDEFAEILRRQLGAEDVRFGRSLEGDAPSLIQVEEVRSDTPVDAETSAQDLTLRARIPNGQWLEVRWAEPPEPREGLKERLELLVTTFAATVGAAPTSPPSTTPSSQSGAEESRDGLDQLLAVLAQRAAARQALVIDAHSPVVWGVAYGDAVAIERRAAPLDNVRFLRGAGQSPDFATVRQARGIELGVEVFDTVVVDPALVGILPGDTLERLGVLPLYRTGETLLVAMTDPKNFDAVRAVVEATGLPIEPVLAPPGLVRFVTRWNRRRSSERPETKPSRARDELAERVVQKLASRYAARQAIRVVRAMPEISLMRRGAHLNRTVAGEGYSVLVRSFATIYLLVLLLPETFDELRAKHAVAQTLPAIESLVLSIPPFTPRDPEGAARALRRRR